MSDGITYCPDFPEDTISGAIRSSSYFLWTSSCIANPEYEDMLEAVLHAVASSESSDTPFLVVIISRIWDDTPWNSASIRGHTNISTLSRILTGHMRCVQEHRQSDDMSATLPPAKWSIELVLVSDEARRVKYLDRYRIHIILALVIQDVCHETPALTKFFSRTNNISH